MDIQKVVAPSVLALLLAVGVPFALHADDQVRSAQESLKTEGFYNGTVDGELNADTKGALRRYQVRNGLDPSGTLSPETLAALNKGGSGDAPPAVTPEPSAVNSATPAAETAAQPPPVPHAALSGDMDSSNQDTTPQAPAETHQGPPTQPSRPPAGNTQIRPSGASDPAFGPLFSRGPYQNAPATVQQNTLLRAQQILAKRGFYSGDVNGSPGPDTTEALLRFQSAANLPHTGRMDVDTLAQLHLLPIAHISVKTIHGEPVYQGKVPQGRPVDGPPGAVRGIQMD